MLREIIIIFHFKLVAIDLRHNKLFSRMQTFFNVQMQLYDHGRETLN